MPHISADVVVLGAGSVGTMAAWQLSKQGHRVVAIDRSSVPGPFSGYAGESRLFRMIYREGAQYMPLLLRSRDLWRELEQDGGRELLRITGGVTIGRPGVRQFDDLLQVSTEQGLEFELLDGTESRKKFPLHQVDDDAQAFFDPNSGYVRSEQAVLSASALARAAGTEFLEHRTVSSIEQKGENWQVTTDQETVSAPRVIVATGTGAGAWGESLGTHIALRPQVLTWFPIRDAAAYAATPQHIFTRYESDASFYGFPSADGWSVKVAASVYLDEVDSYDHPFEVHPHYLDTVIANVEKYMPGLEPRPVRTATCADGYTVDHTALLGKVNGLDGIVTAVGLSGHGFKLATAFGAIAAELAIDGASSTEIGFMDPNRFLAEGVALDRVVV